MPKFLYFLLGILVGAVLVYINSSEPGDKPAKGPKAPEPEVVEAEPLSIVEEQPVSVTDAPSPAELIEVKGRNGYVTLSLGMPKDSVKVLLGRPDRTRMSDLGNIVEQWEYDFPGQGRYGTTRELDIHFKNGKLESISEY